MTLVVYLISLIITDIDTINKNEASRWVSVYPEIGKKYKTGNNTVKSWVPNIDAFDEVVSLSLDKKESIDFPVRVAYQYKIEVQIGLKKEEIYPYTFEDALIFENINVFRTLKGIGLIGKVFSILSEKKDAKSIGIALYEALGSAEKAKFALELLFLNDPKTLVPPKYISECLEWLRKKLTIAKSNLPNNLN